MKEPHDVIKSRTTPTSSTPCTERLIARWRAVAGDNFVHLAWDPRAKSLITRQGGEVWTAGQARTLRALSPK
jgi:hypothetical protein